MTIVTDKRTSKRIPLICSIAICFINIPLTLAWSTPSSSLSSLTRDFRQSPLVASLSSSSSSSSLLHVSRKHKLQIPQQRRRTSSLFIKEQSKQQEEIEWQLLEQNDKSDKEKDQQHHTTTNNNDNVQFNFKDKLFLGIEPTPEILAIMAIYFVEGALGLARLAQTFYLKDTLHLGPAELSALTGLFTLPWTVKPLYGFLSDGLPLFGYRRRSYLILCGLLGSLSYLALGTSFFGLGLVDDVSNSNIIQATIASFVISSGCIAFSDVVADGIVVQRTRDSDDPKIAGGLQSLCWGSASIGALISAYFSGSLLEVIGPTDVFKITAVLPLLVASIALFINEEPISKKSTNETKNIDVSSLSSAQDFAAETQPGNLTRTPSLPISVNQNQETAIAPAEVSDVSTQIESLWKAIKEPAVWKPALFLFLWQSTPTSEGAFLYFMTNDLGFGPEFLGRVRLVTAAASLVGVWGYQKFLREVPIKKILLWTTIASAPLGLINLLLISHANRSLGIPDSAFVFGDDVVLAILGEFAFLPTLVLAARICPPGVEAVLFATLMSIFNGASTVGTEVGAVLTKMFDVTENNFENLGLLTIICNLTSLYPLLFIGLLDGVGTKSEAELEEEQQQQDL